MLGKRWRCYFACQWVNPPVLCHTPAGAFRAPDDNPVVDPVPPTNHRVITTVLFNHNANAEHRMVIRWLIQCRQPTMGLSPRCSLTTTRPPSTGC